MHTLGVGAANPAVAKKIRMQEIAVAGFIFDVNYIIAGDSLAIAYFRMPWTVRMKTKALDFMRRKVSITHLLFDEQTRDLLGYFTLAHKPLAISCASMSATQRKRVERFSDFDASTGNYMVSAYLIAQIGKNYAAQNGKRVTGAAMLKDVVDLLKRIQFDIGGQIMFLECEKGNDRLLAFYASLGFVRFSSRVSKIDGCTYEQLLYFIR